MGEVAGSRCVWPVYPILRHPMAILAVGIAPHLAFVICLCIYVSNNIWVDVNNDAFGHKWGDSPIIFTTDAVTSENYWRITPRVTKISLCTAIRMLFYFLHVFVALNTEKSLITPIDRSPRPCCLRFYLQLCHSWKSWQSRLTREKKCFSR